MVDKAEGQQGSLSRDSGEGLDAMLPQVYNELRVLASRQLRGEREWHTLNTTDLVNEAYLKLRKQDQLAFVDKHHFLAMASVAMRRILVDYARQKKSKKRGGEFHRIEWDESRLSVEQSAEQVLAIDEALDWLAKLEPRLARIVELRFFGGLTFTETAKSTGMGLRTLKRDWKKAQALLFTRLAGQLDDDAD